MCSTALLRRFRPDFDGFNRFNPAGEFVPFNELLLLNRRNGHCGWRRSLLLLTLATAANKKNNGQRQGSSDSKSFDIGALQSFTTT